jgi:hypothetical protein
MKHSLLFIGAFLLCLCATAQKVDTFKVKRDIQWQDTTIYKDLSIFIGSNTSNFVGYSLSASSSTTVSGVFYDDSLYKQPEIQPQYPGGKDSMNAFISRNLKTPASCKTAQNVTVVFTVELNGAVSGFKVSSAPTGCYMEATRIAKLITQWVPAMQNGKNVRSEASIVIPFN